MQNQSLKKYAENHGLEIDKLMAFLIEGDYLDCLGDGIREYEISIGRAATDEDVLNESEIKEKAILEGEQTQQSFMRAVEIYHDAYSRMIKEELKDYEK